MKPVFIDFETYWSVTHSLSKMSPIAYVMHPETEIISAAIKLPGKETAVVFGEDRIRMVLDRIDWSDKLCVGHNLSGFDAMVLAWRFGVRPRMWGCTLAMARAKHSKTTGNSLGKLVEFYNLGVKDQTALVNTKGKHLCDFTPEELAAMKTYNRDDTEQCAGLFYKLLPETPKAELQLIDMTIRMLVEPQFVVDQDLLRRTLAEEKQRKQDMLARVAEILGVDTAEEAQSILASGPKFKALLEQLGVEVPMKTSKATGKPTAALAKTDEEFLALQDHDNPMVAAAAQARLGVKSTILETRIQAFLDASDAADGKLPITLNYYGADTTGRWSGWGYNPQNLPRVSGKPSDALRKCLTAPKGYKIVVADLSGIELRVNHFLWKSPSSMALYQADPEKADLYKDFASKLYGIDVAEVTKPQRQVGKVAHLGLGFGSGAATFQKVAKLMGGVDITLKESEDIVGKWRGAYQEIVNGWKRCHTGLSYIICGEEFQIDPWGLCYTTREGIRTPKGLIRYPKLRQEGSESGKLEWCYGEGRHKAKLYGGKINENCLAEGTLVLTDSGWKPIEFVTILDKVHDGVEFVTHSGTIFKSVQKCVTVDGVYMTPDHEVLTDDGWKEASQLPRPYRPSVRRTDRLKSITQRRKEMALGVQMPVWGGINKIGPGRYQRVEARRNAELRLHDSAVNRQGQFYSRDDEASRVRGVAGHARQVQLAIAQGLEKLRGAWNNRMRTVVEVFREVLGGHGAFVPARVGTGQTGQQRVVLTRKLPVGISSGERYEQTNDAASGHSKVVSGDRDSKVYAVLPTETRAVFDIVNCGPRHRFVVLGTEGPFVVHNCVQHLARCVIADNALEVRKLTGFNPCLMVHDELVYVVPETIAEDHLGAVQQIMRTPPTWWPELVTWSEGDLADTYGDAK